MLLILDGNNLAWAGFHALRRSIGADTPERKVRAALLGLTQAVFGAVIRGGEPPDGQPAGQRRLGETRTGLTGVTIAFDEGRPVRRRLIYPAYQTGRETDPAFTENEPHVLAAISAFIELAGALPVEVLRGVDTEADDLVAARALAEPGEVRVVSTDRDFLQLVDERLSVYSPVKRVVITAANFGEYAAARDASGVPAMFPRERYLDYRVASGDSSDDLPGIPGVGALTAARLVAEAPLDAYLAEPGRAAAVLGRRNAKLEAALASGEARLIAERNRALMDLRAAASQFRDLGPYRMQGRWEPAALAQWFDEHRPFGFVREAIIAAFDQLAETTEGGQRR